MKIETAYKGTLYPRFFRCHGKYASTYSSSNMKPIRCIFKIPYLFALYWVIKPIREEVYGGWDYKDEVLELLSKEFDIKIQYCSNNIAEQYESIPYHKNFRANLRDNINKYPPDKVMIMFNVYSRIDGGYVGEPNDAYYYYQRGISQIQKRDKSKGSSCCIGFNEKENKWYGWSHRAIYGFTIGSEVKMGHCGFMPSNKEEMLQDLKRFWCNDEHHYDWQFELDTHVKPTPKTKYSEPIEAKDGLMMQKPIDVCEGEYEEVPDYLKNKLGIRYSYKYKRPKDNNVFSQESFEPYPDKWGRGEWIAQSMEDARQMACDFASGVS